MSQNLQKVLNRYIYSINDKLADIKELFKK